MCISLCKQSKKHKTRQNATFLYNCFLKGWTFDKMRNCCGKPYQDERWNHVTERDDLKVGFKWRTDRLQLWWNSTRSWYDSSGTQGASWNAFSSKEAEMNWLELVQQEVLRNRDTMKTKGKRKDCKPRKSDLRRKLYIRSQQPQGAEIIHSL